MAGLSSARGNVERIGIFGGTFDPPHLGHLILASEAWHQLELDVVLWVLTPVPPHKPGQKITPLPDRLAMLELAIKDQPAFQISSVEMDRPPPHYAVDTIKLIRTARPDAHLTYLVGGDSLRDFPTWYMAGEIVASLDRLGVMRRPGEPIDLAEVEAELPGISQKIGWVRAPLLEIASSDIRKRIEDEAPFRYFLPEAVLGYIVKHGLYN